MPSLKINIIFQWKVSSYPQLGGTQMLSWHLVHLLRKIEICILLDIHGYYIMEVVDDVTNIPTSCCV